MAALLAALLAWGAAPAAAAAQPSPPPTDGRSGSVRLPSTLTRAALLDAVRRAVGTTSRFRVHHIRTNGRWAFVRATGVVELDGDELQETDLDVAALLERRDDGAGAQWVVAELWTLPTEGERPDAAFLARVRARQRAERLPAALFPPDL